MKLITIPYSLNKRAVKKMRKRTNYTNRFNSTKKWTRNNLMPVAV